MKVMVIDDSKVTQLVLRDALEGAGYEVVTFGSAKDAFAYFDLDGEKPSHRSIDLIIMGLMMPGITGIDATLRLKEYDDIRDIPVVMITAKSDDASLRGSFDAGAADFINKSPNRVELLARCRSLLKLKQEMDERKAVAHQLEEANKHLQRLSAIDGLTGIPNRRTFDEFLAREWGRALRAGESMAVILVDIDSFKPYNDNYGHQAGDETLRKVAQALAGTIHRSADVVARYGGEEFCFVLGGMDRDSAAKVAEQARKTVSDLGIPHAYSKATDHVTLSLGVASRVPSIQGVPQELVEEADKALYVAKESGRNRYVVYGPDILVPE